MVKSLISTNLLFIKSKAKAEIVYYYSKIWQPLSNLITPLS